MVPKEHAVWLLYGFYLLNLLVPIIPAVIIYRLFPEARTNNTVEGGVGGWKVKAIGAWGAYVTAFLLGFWATGSTAVSLIGAVTGQSVWEIESDFQLTDENGKEIRGGTLENLVVQPPNVQPAGTHATIKLISKDLNPPPNMTISMQGYEPRTIELKSRNGTIEPPGRITLQRLSRYAPTSTLLAGSGPPPLTSNQ